jgi:peptidoglycan/LPS O-acetylase OafA/YrhL
VRVEGPATSPARDGPAGFADRLLSRLSRVTSGGSYIAEVDGLRFLAISWVIVTHIHYFLIVNRPGAGGGSPTVGNPLEILAHAAQVPVRLFFAISGFILGRPFAEHALAGRPKVDLGAYFARRVTRLEPPYLLCILGLYALRAAIRPMPAAEYWTTLAASCFYANGWLLGSECPVNFVAWSLEVEVQFYILAPWLARAFDARPAAVRRGVLVAAMVSLPALAWLTGFDRTTLADRTILGHLAFFLAGFLLADLHATTWRGEEGRRTAWDLAFLAAFPVLVAAERCPARWSVVRELVEVAFVGLALASALRGRWARRALANRWVATIGGMCYSIYLLHVPLIGLLGRRTVALAGSTPVPVDLLVQVALLMPPILAVGAAYFALVERPCMRRDWPRALLARLRFRGQGAGVTTGRRRR